jgi:hypothetical protein
MTNPIWQQGMLIKSEQLTTRFSEDSEKWAERVCAVFGTQIPKTLPEVTNVSDVGKQINKYSTKLDKDYECVRDGLSISLPARSLFSTVEETDVKEQRMQQAVLAQPLPWMAAALLRVSETNKRITKKVQEQLYSTHQLLYTLLENVDEVTTTKQKLVEVKSFVVSKVCLFHFSHSTTNYLTWDAALENWTIAKKISGSSISNRVKKVMHKLCSISCLEAPPSNHEIVTFSSCKNPSAEDHATFRSFVAERSEEYIRELFNIPNSFKKILCPIFEQHESIRLLVLYYCFRLNEIKKTSSASDHFLQTASKELSPLHEIALNEFFSILAKTARNASNISETIQDKLKQRTSKISAFYIQLKPHLDNLPMPLYFLIEHFYNLERFMESIELLSAINMHKLSSELKTHPLEILFSSSEIGRKEVKESSEQWKEIQQALLLLETLQKNYAFSIEPEDLLVLALLCVQKKSKNIDIEKLFECYSEFAKNTLSTSSPLERLDLLLNFDIKELPPFFSAFTKKGTTTVKEEEYSEALKKILSFPRFLPNLETIIKKLCITPTLEDVVLACTWGKKKGVDISEEELPLFIQSLERYAFTNCQKILLVLEFRYCDAVKIHYEMLLSLENYLRLTLPRELAFSWLVFHEMTRENMQQLLSQLTEWRDLEALDNEKIYLLNTLLSTQFKESSALPPIPNSDIHYKGAIKLFCLRSLYNQEESSSSASFFPNMLPYPLHPTPSLFSSCDKAMRYQASHQAFFGSWKESGQGYFDYSLFMVKNPMLLETCSSTFRLEISKQRLLALSESDAFKHAFLREMLKFFLSNMSLLTKYTGNTVSLPDLNTALKALEFSEKLAKDTLLITALKQYERECYEELQALFLFAYKLHHFVRKNFIKFSKPLETTSDRLALPQLLTMGSVYDCGETLSLLPPSKKGDYSAFEPCFSINKKGCSFTLETSQHKRMEKFYEKEQMVEKEVLYDLSLHTKILKVKISLHGVLSSTRDINYPIGSFLTLEQIQQLIAWQTLLMKSAFYQLPQVSVSDVQKQFANLKISTDKNGANQ